MPARAWQLLLLIIACSPLAPALPASAGEQDELDWQTIFRGTAEVNVVNVDAVVTTADGRPVTGLEAKDFRVFENGKPVEISNFFATEGGRERSPDDPGAPPATDAPAAAPERPHYLLLLVDQANIGELNRARVFEQLRKFLLDSWRPELRVMVASNQFNLTVHGEFAHTPHEVFATLESIQAATSTGPRFDLERRQLLNEIGALNVEAGSGFFATSGGSSTDFQPEVTQEVVTQTGNILARIRGLSEQQLNHARLTLEVIGKFVSLAAGLPGRKSVIYVSDGLPLRPGEPLIEAFARRLEPMAGRIDFNPELEAGRYDLSLDFRELVTRANTGGVTFYPLYSDRPASIAQGSAATASSAGGVFGRWSSGVQSGLERNAKDSLILMADETGGRTALAVTAADEVLRGMIQDGDHYYSLGYIAERLSDDSAREVRVEVADPSWQVRFRRRFRDRSVVERTEERTRTALLVRPETNPLEISLQPLPPQPQEDGTFIVPLRIAVPLSQIILLPGTAEHQAQVSIFVMVRDPHGRLSEMTRHLCPIRVPNDQILAARGRSAACGVALRMRGGPQRIAVSLLDEIAAADSTVALDVAVGGLPDPAEG